MSIEQPSPEDNKESEGDDIVNFEKIYEEEKQRIQEENPGTSFAAAPGNRELDELHFESSRRAVQKVLEKLNEKKGGILREDDIHSLASHYARIVSSNFTGTEWDFEAMGYDNPEQCAQKVKQMFNEGPEYIMDSEADRGRSLFPSSEKHTSGISIDINGAVLTFSQERY